MLRWKTAKIEVVVDEEEGPGGDPHERRDAGGNESRDMLQEAHHAAYAEEVVREREDVGVGVPDGGTGLGIVVPSEAAGEGVRGWEYVVGEGVGGGRVQGRVERRERGRERQSTEGAGLRGYGYVTDVGARWF